MCDWHGNTRDTTIPGIKTVLFTEDFSLRTAESKEFLPDSDTGLVNSSHRGAPLFQTSGKMLPLSGVFCD